MIDPARHRHRNRRAALGPLRPPPRRSETPPPEPAPPPEPLPVPVDIESPIVLAEPDRPPAAPAIPQAIRVAIPLAPWQSGASPTSEVLDEVWAEVLTDRGTKHRWPWSAGTVGLRRTADAIFCDHRTSAAGSRGSRVLWRLRQRWPFVLGLLMGGWILAAIGKEVLGVSGTYVPLGATYAVILIVGLGVIALWKDRRSPARQSRDPLAGYPKPRVIHPHEIERFEVVPRGLRVFLSVRHPVDPRAAPLSQSALLTPHGTATMEDLVGTFDWLAGLAVLEDVAAASGANGGDA